MNNQNPINILQRKTFAPIVQGVAKATAKGPVAVPSCRCASGQIEFKFVKLGVHVHLSGLALAEVREAREAFLR